MAFTHKRNEMICSAKKGTNRKWQKKRTEQYDTHSNKWTRHREHVSGRTHTKCDGISRIVHYMAPTPYYKHCFQHSSASTHACTPSLSLMLSLLLYILRLHFYLSCIIWYYNKCHFFCCYCCCCCCFPFSFYRKMCRDNAIAKSSMVIIIKSHFTSRKLELQQ